ncbi:MAG TPA: hypothetical protein PLB04_05005 [Nitrospira sp.]|nr:hypothetical protein [Nitrospira sp.]
MRTNLIFSKYRETSRKAAKQRLLWELNGGARALGEFLLNLIRLAFILFVIVMVLAWTEELSAKEDHAFSQAHRIQQLELALLSCLNYKGVYLDGELHLCGFANTWIKAE